MHKISQRMQSTSSLDRNDIDIESLVEKISTDGKEELDSTHTKQLKAYCKLLGVNKEVAINKLGQLVLHQLEKNHAQIRYGSLLIIEYLFQRSHLFRLFICENLDTFFKLCLDLRGFNSLDQRVQLAESSKDFKDSKARASKKNILQPVLWAKKLRTKATECFSKWHLEFSSAYKILKNGFVFLEKQNLISFSNSSASTNAASSSKYNLLFYNISLFNPYLSILAKLVCYNQKLKNTQKNFKKSKTM